MHPQTEAFLREAARTLVACETGKAHVPTAILDAARSVLAYLAPNCTPEQVANGECPK
jgi:hypothetical protein